MHAKKAIIIGAGPAGLTAAYELLERTDIKPVILEASGRVGGICCTIEHHGNRMDLGGHRFFSKSGRIMNWWLNILPLQKLDSTHERITYQNKTRFVVSEINDAPDPEKTEKVMLLRSRKSRIYFLGKFFSYPVKLNFSTLRSMGLFNTVAVTLSYIKSILFPVQPENNLEDFFTNRFGKKLYELFFKSYTEKVWGQSCREISAEWGRQRIKGLSIGKAIRHFFTFGKNKNISQKATETTLIEKFLYPKYGPGFLWDEVAKKILERGGEIHLNHRVSVLHHSGSAISSVEADTSDGEQKKFNGDYFFSTMPVNGLLSAMEPPVPDAVKSISDGLQYRDFITVGVLLKRFRNNLQIPDNWIYIQEPDVKLGRLQIYNNWSPWMVKDKNTRWVGLEYFCNDGDELWKLSDQEMADFAITELEKISLINKEDVLDSHVVHVPKAYPAYFGTYPHFEEIKKFTDRFENLFLIGRNGMHRYNNQDHSMLAAMTAVDNIVSGITSKENIWKVNTEEDYLEER